MLGSTIGVSVDERDHVWIIHRGSATLGNNEKGLELKPPTGECCAGAPPVLEFDPDGQPRRPLGWSGRRATSGRRRITASPIDYKGNVWIGGNGDAGLAGPEVHEAAASSCCRSARPARAQGGRTTRRDSRRTSAAATIRCSFGRVAKIFVDPTANEAYIADGYLNKRVAVLDADTGKLKRYWGAYGNKPDDTNLGPYNPEAPPAQQFRNPVHCAELSNDGLVYVCDRAERSASRCSRRTASSSRKRSIAKNSLGDGSVWDIAFSKDPQQTYIFLADGGT